MGRGCLLAAVLACASCIGDGGEAIDESGDSPTDGVETVKSAVTLANCVAKTGTRTDPNTAWSWNKLWTCGNKGGASLYASADTRTKTGTMLSTSSWFVCYRRGATHSGGNNVWYYTLGDTAVSGLNYRVGTHSGAWGYMPAGDVWTSTDPSPGVPPCPESATPPPRTDGWGLSTYPFHGKAVMFIHGYLADGGPSDWYKCNSYWGAAKAAFAAGPSPEAMTGALVTWGYYGQATDCDFKFNGSIVTPLRELASNLAWDIYERYSRWGQPIDVVAHSMGGLIIRGAITGVQKGEQGPRGTGFPPYIYVEDVATLSTPHRGTDIAALCTVLAPTKQCIDMSPGSAYQTWLGDNPQATGIGTDWTLLGSELDAIVHPASALAAKVSDKTVANMPIGHKILYQAPQYQLPVIIHEDIMRLTGGPYVMKYCDFFNTDCNMANADTGNWIGYSLGDYAPIRMARLATWHQRIW